MPQKLIIDADPGIGDALAITLALIDPSIDLVAVTATAGSVSGREASRNVQAIIGEIDPPKWPRLGASQEPAAALDIEHASNPISPKDLNGEHGLGDFHPPEAELHHPHESHKLMCELVRDSPGEITILTLGPLTNLARACERSPSFLQQVGGLVCFGGSVLAGGNVTAAAEFNMYADPEAARMVLRGGAPTVLVPLDIANQVELTLDQLDRIVASADVTGSIFLRELLPFAFRAHHEHLAQESLSLQELVALSVAIHPKLFEQQPMAIDVEISGEITRGATVFDRRGIQQRQTNIHVATEIDAQGVVDYLTQVITR